MKKYLDLLLKYFSLIIAIPPIFGAIWQLIELAKMSLSYIRFFSVSQLVADGILILIILVFFSFWGLILYPNKLNPKNKESDKVEKDESIEKITEVKNPKIILGIIYSIITLILLYVWAIPVTNYFIDNIKKPIIHISLVPLNILLLSVVLITILNSLEHFKALEKQSLKHFIKSYFIMIPLIFISSVFFKYYSEFNKFMLLPKNLENTSKIENEIKAKYPNTSVKLKYLNDKYIFYSITDSDKKEKFKIIKFDNLFEE